MRVWDELTPEQRDAIVATVTPPAASPGSTVGFGFAGAGQASPLAPVLADTIQAQAAQLRSDIAARFGDFEGTMDVHVARRDDADKDLGVAFGSWTSSGTSSRCSITIFPNATATDSNSDEDINAAAQRLRNTIAHEVFHCFQYAGYGRRQAWAGAPG